MNYYTDPIELITFARNTSENASIFQMVKD